MVRQYPHILTYVAGATGTPTLDGSGNWLIPGGNAVTKHASCRAEMNGSGRTISLADGSKTEYSFVIYLPKLGDVFSPGSQVQVFDNGRLLVDAKVIQYSAGSLNRKIYV